MENKELVIVRDCEHVRHRLVMGSGVHELAAGNHGGGLGQPGREPIGRYFAFRLIARPRSSIESVEGRRAEE